MSWCPPAAPTTVPAAAPNEHAESEDLLYTGLAFLFWLTLIVLTALGVHRMLELFGKPKAVEWILLPGVIVAEMAYVFGCLITGGEVRNARLFPSGKGKGRTTEVITQFKGIGPVLADLAVVAACVACIIAVHGFLGEPIIRDFIVDDTTPVPTVGPDLSTQLPTTAQELWDFPGAQVLLVRKMYETCLKTSWLDWRAVLFVYLGLCLSIRLAPVRRPVRPALGTVALAAVILALVPRAGAEWAERIDSLWLLLTYIWSSLLFTLLIAALARGGVYLVSVLRGQEDQTQARHQ